MSLFWKCPCYICSHQLQYEEFRRVIQTKTGWSRLYPSTMLCLGGTGHIKDVSKHTVAVPVGAMVSWSSHRYVWRAWLVLLCHGAILLLCRGHESMSGTFYLSVSICTVYLLDLLNPLLCHLPCRKTCHVETISVLQSIRLLWEADLLQHC